MAYVKCHCEHSKDSHEMGTLSCTLCECTLYRPETADDPFRNNIPAKMIRLLALARESDYAKTRKLGAKIEEMLGELELLSEQELSYKAELARNEQERKAAEKKLEEARAILAEAEKTMQKYTGPVLPKGRSRRSPKFSPESLVVVPCDFPRCNQKIQRRVMGVHKYAAHGIRKEESNA